MREVESKAGIRPWMQMGRRPKSKGVTGALVLEGSGADSVL